MPTLIDRTGPIDDVWSWYGSDAGPEAPGTPGSHLILPLARWASDGESLIAGGAKVGICLEPADEPADIADALGRLDLVAVRFPAFTDGRGYSTARLLRQRYGWQGELRAVGDVLRDQMFYLARCGFSTFDLKDGESVAGALAGLGDFTEAYQAAADRGPLFKRRQRAALAASTR